MKQSARNGGCAPFALHRKTVARIHFTPPELTPIDHLLFSARTRFLPRHNFSRPMSQKILVIDDSLAASKLTETIVAQNFNGVDVLLAQCGADAFDRFNIAQPDLILLNEVMPDMDGEAICFRLLNDPATARVPVVVMASNGQVETFENRYTNVVKVLRKPVAPDALLEIVTTTLAKPKPQGNPARQLLFYDPARAAFSGHTGFFRSARHCRWLAAIN